MVHYITFTRTFTVHWQNVSLGWGAVGGCGGGEGGHSVGGRSFGACMCLVLGRFLGAVTDGEWGRDIYTKGTNAPRPATISRPGKVTWCLQAIVILHLVLVAPVLFCILG
jgi:hypothetical protein